MSAEPSPTGALNPYSERMMMKCVLISGERARCLPGWRHFGVPQSADGGREVEQESNVVSEYDQQVV